MQRLYSAVLLIVVTFCFVISTPGKSILSRSEASVSHDSIFKLACRIRKKSRSDIRRLRISTPSRLPIHWSCSSGRYRHDFERYVYESRGGIFYADFPAGQYSPLYPVDGFRMVDDNKELVLEVLDEFGADLLGYSGPCLFYEIDKRRHEYNSLSLKPQQSLPVIKK